MLTRIPSHYDATEEHYYRNDAAMQDAMVHKVSFAFKEKEDTSMVISQKRKSCIVNLLVGRLSSKKAESILY